MSWLARRLSRKARATCDCGHRAVFVRPHAPGRALAARRDHPLCRRCWRAAASREKARQMAAARLFRLNPASGPFALLW
jgi:hypothetical protein